MRASSNRPAEAKAAELRVYGYIGEQVTAHSVAQALDGLKGTEQLHVWINSLGGNVFESVEIHNLLARHKGEVIAHLGGIVASGASLIAMAADKRVAAKNATVMFHDPSGVTQGTAADHKKSAQMLEAIRTGMIATYADRTGMPAKEVSALMLEETWMDAHEAKEMGFCDSVTKTGEVGPEEEPDEDEDEEQQDDDDERAEKVAAVAAALTSPRSLALLDQFKKAPAFMRAAAAQARAPEVSTVSKKETRRDGNGSAPNAQGPAPEALGTTPVPEAETTKEPTASVRLVEQTKSPADDVVARLQRELDAERSRITELEAAAERREFTTRASAELKHVPGLTAEEKGDVLCALEKGRAIPEASAKKLKAALLAVNAQIEIGALFKEHGTRGEGEADPQAKLDKVAAELRAANPNLSLSDALLQAALKNPGAVAEMR